MKENNSVCYFVRQLENNKNVHAWKLLILLTSSSVTGLGTSHLYVCVCNTEARAYYIHYDKL